MKFFYGIIIFLISLIGFAQKGEKAMQLKDKSFIKLSGGCEWHSEAQLDFVPVPDGIDVQVSNQKYFFDSANNFLKNFTTKISTADFDEFAKKLKNALGVKTEKDSSAELVIEIFLPMQNGKLSETVKNNEQVEALVSDFVNKIKPASVQKNKTNEFLGSTITDWSSASVELYEHYGLYGANSFFIRGTGEVFYRYIVYSAKKKSEERIFKSKLDKEKVSSLFKVLIDEDLFNLNLNEGKREPETPYLKIIVKNHKQEKFEKMAWADNAPRKHFDTVYKALKRLHGAAENSKPKLVSSKHYKDDQQWEKTIKHY